MIELRNNLESGAANQPVLAADTGSPDAWNLVQVGSGASVVYEPTQVAHGSRAARFATGATAAQVYLQWNTSGESVLHFRFNLFLEAAPTVNHRLLHFGNASGSCVDLELRTDRTVRLRNMNSGGHGFFPAVPLNTWVRVEGRIEFRTPDGVAQIRMFYGKNSITPDVSWDSGATGEYRGPPTYVRFGIVGNTSNQTGLLLDDMGISSANWLGPVVPPNLAPTVVPVSPAFRLSEIGKTETLAVSASDPEGLAMTYAWSVVQGAGEITGSGSSIQFKPTVVGSSVVRCTVTDSAGNTAVARLAVHCWAEGYRKQGSALVPAVVRSMPSYRDRVLADDPLAYWPLDESSGSVAHDEGRAEVDLSGVAGPAFGIASPVQPGTAASFLASGSYFEAPNADPLRWTGGDLSLECWAYFTGLTGTRVLLANRTTGSSNVNYTLFLANTPNVMCFDLGADRFQTTWTPAVNRWYHIVATWQLAGSTRRFYVDGVEVGTKTTGVITPPSSSGIFRIAGMAATTSNGGYIDEVAIYDSLLTPAKIARHYAARKLAAA